MCSGLFSNHLLPRTMNKASHYCLLFVLAFSTSCASIVSKSTYPLTVNTFPSGVKIVVKNGDGQVIFNGMSPATVSLKASAKFFKKAAYTVNVSADGYAPQTLPVNFKLDAWYFGNLAFGGVIGMLIVDPATGAMYKIENEYMNIVLSESNAIIDGPSLNVYDLADVPVQHRDKLVKITP